MKKTIFLLSVISVFIFSSKTVNAHCEVPCGIFHDELRIELIKEHIETIKKSMNQIMEIQNSSEINYNQLVRWINTKEDHANKIQEIAEQYFLAQRVKFASPDDKEKYSKYITQLTYLHEIVVYAMKTKQSTDLSFTEKLAESLVNFENAYFGPDAHRHDHKGNHK